MPNQNSSNVSYRQALLLLRRYLGQEWQRVLLLAVLLIGGIGLQLLQPQLLRDFIDLATDGIEVSRFGRIDSLTTLALIFIAIALFNHLLRALAGYLTQDVSWRTTNALRADLAQHTLSLDMGYHNNHTAGELVSRINGDIEALSNFFSRFVILVIGNGLMLIGVIVILYLENWRVGLGFIGLVLLTILIIRRTFRLAEPWLKIFWEQFGMYFGFFEERLNGIEDIRANGAVAYTMKRYHETMRMAFAPDRNAFVLSLIPAASSLGLFNLGSALGLGLGGWLYMRDVISLGSVYVILTYTQLMLDPLRLLMRQLQDFQRASAAANRVQDLYFTQSTLDPNEDAPFPLAAAAPTIQFEQVDFRYAVDTPVLQKLSFRVEAGKVLGLLGRTGSGKTTITRLLFRLYDVNAGAIKLDDTNIATLPLGQLRRHIGMVTQDVQLFNASIRDNLTFFDATIADDAILTALHDLELGDWFTGLPDGLDTLIGAGGRGMSAGEAQLLAFTRVFLQDPHIIILDEASSRLDPATERLIERAIDKLLANRTAIIIAHRLATVQRVDDVLILEQGQLLEHGARADLVADDTSRFAQLLATGAEEVLV